MNHEEPAVRGWTIPSGGSHVPFSDANVVLLLSAASGLAGALVQADSLPLAMGIAGAYLRMRSDAGSCPISALSRVSTRPRSFEGVCLTETLQVDIDGKPHDIPTALIRRLRICKRMWWQRVRTANIELVDGSEYRVARLYDSQLHFLTLIGRQTVELASDDVLIRGHTVTALNELRDRLEFVLERHRHAVIQTVGRETFERYFKQAA
jgi:hypothetical protein